MKKNDVKTVCKIGGQAVLEGVYMRAPEKSALAVRTPEGAIAIETKDVTPAAKRYPVLGWPFIRGVVSLGSSLANGYKTIARSAELSGEEEETEPSRFELWLSHVCKRDVMDVMMVAAMVMGIALAIGLFFVLPSLAAQLLASLIPDWWLLNLAEGGVRLLVFFGYITLVAMVPDIRRVFAYHGAEHKVIHCYEMGKALTVADAKTCSRLHPRCGTTFLLLVMVISIIVYTVLGRGDSLLEKIGLRIVLLPLIAGVSYEVQRFLASHDGWWARALRAPGLLLQRLTTKEPDEAMLEVSLAAFRSAQGEAEADIPGTAAYAQARRAEAGEDPVPVPFLGEGDCGGVADEEDTGSYEEERLAGGAGV